MTKIEFLINLRKKHKLSRPKIAKILDVSVSYIEKIERGRVTFNSKTKYIQGICALYGYNPNIFNYDEITLKLLDEFKLTQFAKAIRKYLYFSGYSLVFDDAIYLVFNKILFIRNSIDIYSLNYLDNEIIRFIKYIYDVLQLNMEEFDKNTIIKMLIDDFNETSNISNSNKTFLELLIIIGLNKFKPSEFGNINKYMEIISYRDKFLKQFGNLEYESNSPLSFNKEQLKEKLQELEQNGLELQIENIKELKKEYKLKELQNEILDEKSREICELLKYAPDTFKDKIIQKLKTYKEDIESL